MPQKNKQTTSESEQVSGWKRLGFAVALIVGVWGFVLPQVERTSVVQDRIKYLDEHGIEPAAFFYTDHEGMNRWEAEAKKTWQSK